MKADKKEAECSQTLPLKILCLSWSVSLKGDLSLKKLRNWEYNFHKSPQENKRQVFLLFFFLVLDEQSFRKILFLIYSRK